MYTCEFVSIFLLFGTYRVLISCIMDDEDKEESSVKEEHMTSSGHVEECVPSSNDSTDGVLGESTAACTDVMTETIVEAENDDNRTVGCDGVHGGGMEHGEDSPVGVQQMELLEDQGVQTEQQEVNEYVQEDTGSGNLSVRTVK